MFVQSSFELTNLPFDKIAGSIPASAGLTIGSILLCAVAILWFAGRRKALVEDPARVTLFLNSVADLDWSPETTRSSLETLYRSVTHLFEAEVFYYYRARKTRRRAAFAARSGTYLFGTIGLLCPLLATAVPDWDGLTRLGYIFFAAAAACLAGNELFGGTRGHVRAAETQYRIEALLNSFAIDWQRWQASFQGESATEQRVSLDKGFTLLRDLTNQVYVTMSDETKEWAVRAIEAETVYAASIDKQRPSGR